MNKLINIRKASLFDQDSIYRFVCELEETHFDQTDFNTLYQENINNKNNIYLVAEDCRTSKIIGFISCQGQVLLHHLGLVYEIQELFVDKHYRSQGIGKALLKSLEELLPANCKSFEVTAQHKRLDTHQFYQSNNFTSTHLKFTKKY